MEKPTDAEERREYIREQMRKAKKEWEQLRRKWELENIRIPGRRRRFRG